MSDGPDPWQLTRGELALQYEIRLLAAQGRKTMEKCLAYMERQNAVIEELSKEVKELREQLSRFQQGSLFDRRDSL
jgi:hypothetical protein